MILVEEDDYVLGMWVTDGPSSNALIVIKRKPGQRWEIRTRIRHYVDDKVFDSQDPRAFYSFTMDPVASDDDMIQAGREISQMAIELQIGTETHEAIVQSSGAEAFNNALRKLPGMHTKSEYIH